MVCEDDVEAALLDLALNPLPILGTVARIHHEHVLVLGVTIHEHVVDNASATVGHARVLNFAVHEFGRIVGTDPLNECQGIWSFDHELTHVADVKHATCGAYGFMFKFEACILNGHLETCEGDHFGTSVQVGFVQGCSKQGRRFHGAKLGRRLPVRGGRERPKWTFLAQTRACLQTPEDNGRCRRVATLI